MFADADRDPASAERSRDGQRRTLITVGDQNSGRLPHATLIRAAVAPAASPAAASVADANRASYRRGRSTDHTASRSGSAPWSTAINVRAASKPTEMAAIGIHTKRPCQPSERRRAVTRPRGGRGGGKRVADAGA